MKWITGHSAQSYWHRATMRELKGEKTGKVFSSYWVAACSGNRPGGAWGAITTDEEPTDFLCPRCAKLKA
jgi:hypothetical protein